MMKSKAMFLVPLVLHEQKFEVFSYVLLAPYQSLGPVLGTLLIADKGVLLL
jgi:hypothetical protein